jgi:FkbM family methyltransferase
MSLPDGIEMKARLKKLITGTRLELPARWAWQRLRPRGGTAEEVDPEDRWTIEILSRVLEADSNCVDVGCAKGKILQHMLRLAPQGVHYAFEPLPLDAEALRRRYPDARVFEIALSDVSGESTFHHVVTNPGYSGLRRRRYPTDREDVKIMRVRVDRLDDIISRTTRIRFIKIDVEGAELQVLRGAQRTLQRNRPYVAFEHGEGAAEFYGTTPHQVYAFLHETCGLHISLMPDWLAGRPPLERDEFVAQFGGGEHWYFLAHP